MVSEIFKPACLLSKAILCSKWLKPPFNGWCKIDLDLNLCFYVLCCQQIIGWSLDNKNYFLIKRSISTILYNTFSILFIPPGFFCIFCHITTTNLEEKKTQNKFLIILPVSLLCRTTFCFNYSCHSFGVCRHQLCTFYIYFISISYPFLLILLCTIFPVQSDQMKRICEHCVNLWRLEASNRFLFQDYPVLTRFTVPPEEKHLHSMMLPHPCCHHYVAFFKAL